MGRGGKRKEEEGKEGRKCGRKEKEERCFFLVVSFFGGCLPTYSFTLRRSFPALECITSHTQQYGDNQENTSIGEEETRTKRSPPKNKRAKSKSGPKTTKEQKRNAGRALSLSLFLFSSFFFGIIISHKKSSRKSWSREAAKSLAARLPDPTKKHSFSFQSADLADLADSSSKISPCPLDSTFNLLEIPSTIIFTW